MMHALPDYSSSGVPAFLHKLWALVDDESTDELIAWDPSGNSFHVFDQSRFSKEVLPLYFKHSNIASFVRQLNMYGFRKVSNVEHGSLKIEKDDIEFIHPYFKRDHEELLDHIKRKVASTKSDDVKLKSHDVSKVLQDMHSLKGRQENISTKMDTLERENEALWREVANLRQKHAKQQKIVNKLIQFLVTLVGNRGLGGDLKRKMPLMLNDASQLQNPRPAKMARPYYVEARNTSTANIQEIKSPEASASGVTIEEMQDIPHAEEQQVYAVVTDNTGTVKAGEQPQTVILVNQNPGDIVIQAPTEAVPSQVSSSTAASPFSVSVLPPGSTSGQQQPVVLTSAPTQDITTSFVNPPSQLTGTKTGSAADHLVKLEKAETTPYTVLSPSSADTTLVSDPSHDHTRAVAIPESLSTTGDSGHVVDMSSHLNSIEDSLDSLKDLFSGNIEPNSLWNLRLDPDTLQGLFTPEAPLPSTPDGTLFGMGDPMKAADAPDSSDQITGNELIQYNPNEDLGNLFDLGVLSPAHPSELGDDSLALFDSSSTLTTPQIDLTAPFSSQKQAATSKKKSTITTEEVD